MLYADKAALENRTKVKLLAIRERELTLYTNNCRTVGTVSALMAGIAYSALIYTKMAYFQESSVIQQFFYISGLTVCMGLSLRNVLGTTLLTMLGPGKALRGPDGSMHSAVDGMLDSFEGIVIVQHLTIYTFMVTTIAYSWGAATSSVITSVLLTLLVVSVTYTMYIRSRVVDGTFPLRSLFYRGMLVSGAFFPKEQAGSQDQQQQQQQQPTTQSGAGPGAHMPQPTQLPPPGSPAASAYTRIDAWKQLQKDRQEELRQAQAAREAREARDQARGGLFSARSRQTAQQGSRSGAEMM